MKVALSDTHDFVRLITNGNIYVDKTGMLHDLITAKSGSRYFISRPRRFGKSLMISTLKAIFSGRRDLFTNLEICRREYDWENYPIIHLDMSSVIADNIIDLKMNMVGLVRRLARDLDVKLDFSSNGTPSAYFGDLLDELSRKEGDRIVVLIDEYDAPVNRMIESGQEALLASAQLHDFYTQLKVNDSHIRFLLMTGVSKFAKLSVFSGLNNLKDLTLEPEYAGLLGYTVSEIKQYFSEHINRFSKKSGISPELQLAELLKWYDGYRFSPYSEVRVTNPVSLASALDRMRLEAFWDETGQSRLIYEYIKNRGVVPAQLEDSEADRSDLTFCDISNVNSAALLFQTGYLTIKDVLDDGQRLRFGMPNKEVADSLKYGMASYIFKDKKQGLVKSLGDVSRTLNAQPDAVGEILNATLTSAFSAIPYDWVVKDEAEAKRMFLFYCNLMGADIVGESHSNLGRADAVLKLDQAVYVFEFKYGHTALEALEQAEKRNYAGPMMNGEKSIYLVGVNYNPANRNIDEPCLKKVMAVKG